MEYLTGVFAFDIATFAIMSNHFHIVLRSRPDIVASWSDEEVALRNMRLQGKVWFQPDSSPRRTAQAEIRRVTDDPIELARIRRKLSDLSRLMAYFDEYIAKHANAEDEVKGARQQRKPKIRQPFADLRLTKPAHSCSLSSFISDFGP